MCPRKRLTWAEYIAATPDPDTQAANEPQISQYPKDDRDLDPKSEH